MRFATEVHARGEWPEQEMVAAVTLDYESRRRRRARLRCKDGQVLHLSLPGAPNLQEGDGLKLSDGGWIAVHVAEEDLLEVTCDTIQDLITVAWQLGNCHLPLEIHADRLFLRREKVFEDMLNRTDAKVVPVRRPFQPCSGLAAASLAHLHADD
jgi:urease accessory protein